MSTQSEAQLEKEFISKLNGLGYESVSIADEGDLILNLKEKLEQLNKIKFSDKEFQRVLNILGKGNAFERANLLREKKQHILRDNGKSLYFMLIDQDDVSNNSYQVANQVSLKGRYLNRYDVTLFINGLPLVQIELKKRGADIKQAFNQIIRYKKDSYSSGYGFFQFIQLFIISNGVNTKYFANNRKMLFQQTFYWADKENKKISNLMEFSSSFLSHNNMMDMIFTYTVLSEEKIAMVLRPYQYFAVNSLVEKVKTSDDFGYVWHTTGSGKTLTSFKASQILTKLNSVDKVCFVVDRKDLDDQTNKEFNKFEKGSVDGTPDTRSFVSQFKDPKNKLVVTTIQKLNKAIKGRFKGTMDALKDQKVVFIFDECHRSQFGETHKAIRGFFTRAQMFGFTGTPIFAENAIKNDLGKRTTRELFGECLHKYVITDAIGDENVLKFNIEYVGKYRKKSDQILADIDVEAIDEKEVLDSEDRLSKIADYIIANHKRKTSGSHFSSIFCVSSVDNLIKYYDLFKSKDHNLKIATIYSYHANEELDFDEEEKISASSRDRLEEFLKDYKEMFGVSYTTKDGNSFQNYYYDVARRAKHKGEKIDILLVVNMFLTGFDSPPLNTLYVDKNLKYHGLIQAFSRTNRTYEGKSHGNIVCFRNLKEATDDAVALFSNKEAKDVILMKPYTDHVDLFKKVLEKLYHLTPSVDSVDLLVDENEESKFVKTFRELMRIQNTLSTYADFSFEDLGIDEQEFADFKSKYFDIYQKVRRDTTKERYPILDEIDFEAELIHRDEVNVTYILKLLREYVLIEDNKARELKLKQIKDILAGNVQLKSKRELIERFIEKHSLGISEEDIEDEFERYLDEEKKKELDLICKANELHFDKVEDLISDMLYYGNVPNVREVMMKTFINPPSLFERDKAITELTEKLDEFLETFYEKGVA